MSNENSYVNVVTRVIKNQFKMNPIKTGGVLVYGNLHPTRFSIIFNVILHVIVSIILIKNLFDGLVEQNYFVLGLVVLAIIFVARGWLNNKVRAQRVIESDEMLSLWLLNHFPNEIISSSELLKSGITKSLSSNRLFVLEISKTTAKLYAYDPAHASKDPESDAIEFNPDEIHVVENKVTYNS
jgi:hypothetical protein